MCLNEAFSTFMNCVVPTFAICIDLFGFMALTTSTSIVRAMSVNGPSTASILKVHYLGQLYLASV